MWKSDNIPTTVFTMICKGGVRIEEVIFYEFNNLESEGWPKNARLLFRNGEVREVRLWSIEDAEALSAAFAKGLVADDYS